MTTKVDIAPPFHNDLRRLAKKYPAVIRQFETLLRQLQADERPGDKIPVWVMTCTKYAWRTHPHGAARAAVSV